MKYKNLLWFAYRGTKTSSFVSMSAISDSDGIHSDAKFIRI